jgi:hypothetical protein
MRTPYLAASLGTLACLAAALSPLACLAAALGPPACLAAMLGPLACLATALGPSPQYNLTHLTPCQNARLTLASFSVSGRSFLYYTIQSYPGGGRYSNIEFTRSRMKPKIDEGINSIAGIKKKTSSSTSPLLQLLWNILLRSKS